MNFPHSLSSRIETERVIAAARVALAAASFFAIWTDPVEPARYIPAAYSFQAGYFAYALALAAFTWIRPAAAWTPLATHVTDLVLASVLQYVTLGPSSPLFLYFIFCLFCGALRWGWRGSLATGSIVLLDYVAIGALSHSFGPASFEFDRFITRAVYLIVSAGFLVYLGLHRASLSSRTETERVIAAARVALASASLFGVWMGPADPARYLPVTYSLHAVYLAYSMGLVAFTWMRPAGDRLLLVTHATDIIFVSVLQYLTLGPSSPFFLYFIFCLFCGALRWGWQGSLATAGVVLATYVVMGAAMSRTLGATEFELDRFLIRSVYLITAAGFLVYLGRNEARLRGKIERLANWPAVAGSETGDGIQQVLECAVGIVGAGRAVAIWDAGEEPDVHLARWPSEGTLTTKYPPGAFNPPVSPALEQAAFFCAGRVSADSALLIEGRNGLVASGERLHPEVAPWLHGTGLASAPFKTERVSGRVFFTDLDSPVAELIPLTEVVAREIGVSLTQLDLNEQMKELAASEERIRVARDLHDGVLQSLTGIRLELRAIAAGIGAEPTQRDRLFAIERALAIEQRELRFFIEGLDPPGAPFLRDSTLAGRLDEMRERIALEWKMPVTIRLAPTSTALPEQIERAVPLMIHEAVVNALKHGQPSRVAVTVDGDRDGLRIVVTDDGQGFPFRGRYSHAALTETNAGPKSLLDRVAALGGQVSIESTDAGSRVEMVLSF